MVYDWIQNCFLGEQYPLSKDTQEFLFKRSLKHFYSANSLHDVFKEENEKSEEENEEDSGGESGEENEEENAKLENQQVFA